MNANEIKISNNTVIKTMTVEELLTAQAVGDIALPAYQRPQVWKEEQERLLEDTILKGWPYGVITIAKVEQDGKRISLLIDGYQRTTALMRISERLAAQAQLLADQLAAAEDAVNDAYAAMNADAIKTAEENRNKAKESADHAAAKEAAFSAADVTLCEFDTDVAGAAALFVRLNNGTSLSGIQRGCADIDSATLARARGYADILPDTVAGKKSRDEVALMLAAAAVKTCGKPYNAKMSTAGAAAVKTLASADLATLPEAKEYADAAAGYIKAVEGAARQSEYFTASRLVPYIIGSKVYGVTAEKWAEYFVNKAAADRRKVRTDSPAKGKDNTVKTCGKRDSRPFAEVDSDRSNSPKATVARFSALRDLFAADLPQAVAPAEEQAAAEVEAVFAEALR